MTDRRRLAMLLAVLLAVAACSCDGPAPPRAAPTIVFTAEEGTDFWAIARAGAEAGAKDYQADLQVLPAETVEEQQRLVLEAAGRGVAGIAISPLDPARQAGLINQAAARTKVVTLVSDVPAS